MAEQPFFVSRGLSGKVTDQSVVLNCEGQHLVIPKDQWKALVEKTIQAERSATHGPTL